MEELAEDTHLRAGTRKEGMWLTAKRLFSLCTTGAVNSHPKTPNALCTRVEMVLVLAIASSVSQVTKI